jgi:hypothetical protein
MPFGILLRDWLTYGGRQPPASFVLELFQYLALNLVDFGLLKGREAQIFPSGGRDWQALTNLG